MCVWVFDFISVCVCVCVCVNVCFWKCVCVFVYLKTSYFQRIYLFTDELLQFDIDKAFDNINIDELYICKN